MLNKTRIIFNISLILLVILSQSCFKCRDLETCQIPEIGERYFGNYKPGSYWVYYNQDMTKKDSVYVLNYTSELRERSMRPECTEYFQVEMNLLNYYLMENHSLVFSNRGLGCIERYYSFSGVSLYANNENNITVKGGDSFITLQDFSLPFNSDVIYDEVLLVRESVWFAPKYGIIQYLSFENPADTFYLHKTNIQ